MAERVSAAHVVKQEEMHFIWEKHWAWRRWAQDKQRRIEMAKPGTEDFVVSQAHPMAADGAKPV